MAADVEPIEGVWYHHLDREEDFTVVLVDEADGVIEIQDFEGNIEEVDQDEWDEWELEVIDPPEDWGGILGDISPHDLGYEE